MLLVVCGLIGKMGHVCREHLNSRGFDAVIKLNYMSEAARKQNMVGYGERNFVTREEVENCTYRYETNGYLVGFNTEQVEAAVYGQKTSLLSYSSADTEFLKELKDAYEHVYSVYVYTDGLVLENLVREMKEARGMSDAEVLSRLQTGAALRENYCQSPELFDEVVIYGGEESVFDTQALCKQFDRVCDKAVEIEKRLNKKAELKLPYCGNEPYCFFSYAHENAALARELMERMQKKGVRIWYDEGIQVKDHWRKTVIGKVKRCHAFVCLVTEQSVASDWVKREILTVLGDDIDSEKSRIVQLREGGVCFDEMIEQELLNLQFASLTDEDYFEKMLAALPREVFDEVFLEE